MCCGILELLDLVEPGFSELVRVHGARFGRKAYSQKVMILVRMPGVYVSGVAYAQKSYRTVPVCHSSRVHRANGKGNGPSPCGLTKS